MLCCSASTAGAVKDPQPRADRHEAKKAGDGTPGRQTSQERMEDRVVRKLTSEFSEENPYAPSEKNGTLFLPVEAHLQDDDEEEVDQVDSKGQGQGPEESAPSEEALSAPGVNRGVVMNCTLRGDSYKDEKHCTPAGDLKPRRPVPQLRVSELLAGLRRQDSGRWIYGGQLNGWPALVNFELRSITVKKHGVMASIQRIWTAGKDEALPEASRIPNGARAKFVGPSWTAVGWREDAPGFVFWFTAARGSGPTLLLGEPSIDWLRKEEHKDAQCTWVHEFVHRYPVAAKAETMRDRQTWHALILLEWEHQKFTTVLELAWRDGLSGYGGKSNWVEDKLEKLPQIFQAMPESMQGPWDCKLTEIRMVDMCARNKQEFQAYLEKYSNTSGLPLEQQRFYEPKSTASAQARLRAVSQVDIMGYCLNYAGRAEKYEELLMNCQTFAADMFAFLTGTRNHQPYGMLIKPRYQQRTKSFLYRPRDRP